MLFDDMTEPAESADESEKTALPPPRENFLSLGHETIEKQLLKSFNAGRLPHAMIFSGAEGIGKATFAFRLARFLLSRESNDTGMFAGEDMPAENFDIPADHPAARRVTSGGHADLLVVSRVFDEKKSKISNDIPVDEVRKIAPFLHKTSSEGGWRIVIVDEAQHLNRSSQNALLKILEEPPKKAVLILITDQPGRFLPTIRSRCQSYAFQSLDDSPMIELLERAAPELAGEDRKAILKLAEGRIGHAINLLDHEGVSIYREVIELLTKLPKLDESVAFALSESLGRDSKKFAVFMQLLVLWLGNMARETVRDGLPSPILDEEKDLLPRLNSIYSGRDWLERHDEIARILADSDRTHLDMKQTVLDVIWSLEKEVSYA